MKSVRVICIFVFSLMLAALLNGCSDKGQITSSTTKDATTSNTTSKTDSNLHSVYDGTYTGVFSYEYMKRASMDEPWNDKTGVWTPASFNVTVTFKTVEVTAEYVKLDITNVICSDNIFGTGLNGVTPLYGGDTYAYLPVNPPTTITNLSKPDMGITIKFPNFSLLQAPTLTRDGKSLPGFLSVTAAGKILGNSPDASIQNWTWLASTPSGIFLNPSGWGYYQHRFISWTLNKMP